MTRDELRDKELTERIRAIMTGGEIIGLVEALGQVLNARDLADARGGIESLLSMANLRKASHEGDIRNTMDDLRILEAKELDAATKRLDGKMVAAGAIRGDVVG